MVSDEWQCFRLFPLPFSKSKCYVCCLSCHGYSHRFFLRIAVIKTPCRWTASLWAWSFSVLISRAHDTLTFTATSDGSASTSGFQIITPISISPFLPSKPLCCRRTVGRKSHLYFNLFLHNMSSICKAASASLSPSAWWSNRRADKSVATWLCRPVKP